MKTGVKFDIDARSLSANADKELIPHIATAIGLPQSDVLSYRIDKRSLDARSKPLVKIQYQITAEIKDGAIPKKKTIPPASEEELKCFENISKVKHPLVVGAGPAGLFAALALAQAGAEPIVLERGRDVTRRKADIDGFFASRKLSPESNLLFGEGGAGAWSDGKLFTRVRDPRGTYVLKEFVKAGAQPEILYYAHPHIGSDRLPSVISRIRKQIIALGGKFLWDTQVADIEGDKAFRALILSTGERIEAPAAIIACGHSARELLEKLSGKLDTSMKGFQIGCRIEHPQAFVNHFQYGMDTPCPSLGAAEYLFSTHGNDNIDGATTFCMCPGGEILPISCEDGTLSTNGMSNAARSGRFANAAIISTVPADTFKNPRQAFDFIGALERKLFQRGGGDYTCPAQMAGDFIRRTAGRIPSHSSYRMGLCPARIDELLPFSIAKSIYAALLRFDTLAPGYIKFGLMVGMETHVSSPVRFIRNETTLSTSMENLYMAGEGGGMAGGIMSAAIDGIKLAEKILGCNP